MVEKKGKARQNGIYMNVSPLSEGKRRDFKSVTEGIDMYKNPGETGNNIFMHKSTTGTFTTDGRRIHC